MFTPLQSLLHKLWHLWELVLLGRPLMVVAPCPADASNTVAALLSLLAPLPYCADFRPYYTIQVNSSSNKWARRPWCRCYDHGCAVTDAVAVPRGQPREQWSSTGSATGRAKCTMPWC